MSTDDEKEKTGVILKAVAGIITALAALLAVFWGPELTKQLLWPTATPTPISTAALTSTAVFIASPPAPNESPANTLFVPTDTLAPGPEASSVCHWQAYANKLQTTEPSLCLSDVAFGSMGISDAGAGKVDFLVSNNHAGVYGMVLPLGPVPRLAKGFNYAIHLNIKELTAGQFIVAFSPNPRPDVVSTYAISVTPIESYLVTKYFFYNADEIPNQYVFTERPAINSVQGVDWD